MWNVILRDITAIAIIPHAHVREKCHDGGQKMQLPFAVQLYKTGSKEYGFQIKQWE